MRPDPRPLTVLVEAAVWDGILESWFIREVLLGGLERPVRILRVSNQPAVAPVDDVLILNLFDRSVPLIRHVIDAGRRNIGILHMGDEHARCERSYYPDVDYVLRNYYFPHTLRMPPGSRCSAVSWVPNGYRIGVGPRNPNTLLPASLRSDVLVFAGYVGAKDGIPERIEMLEVVNRCKVPATIVKTPGFARGLGPASYAAVMENGRFALVPRGQAPETIRLFDALELGCIPIMLAHDFLAAEDAMAGSPVVRLGSWQELPDWLGRTLSSPTCEADIAALQRRCIDWWSAFKAAQQARVADLIERAFAR